MARTQEDAFGGGNEAGKMRGVVKLWKELQLARVILRHHESLIPFKSDQQSKLLLPDKNI